MNFTEEHAQRCAAESDIADHLPFLFDTACRFPGVSVIELGTRTGESTAAFLAAADAVDGHVWSVDITKPRVPQWWYDSPRWSVHVGDDLAPAAAEFAPPVVDVLFIDTSHAYDHTLAELEAFTPRVRPGGVVLLHDTELEQPEGLPAQPPWPVAKALDVFCATHDLKWDNRSGCWGLGVLQVPSRH